MTKSELETGSRIKNIYKKGQSRRRGGGPTAYKFYRDKTNTNDQNPEEKPGLDTVMNYHKIDGIETDNHGDTGYIGECSPSWLDVMAIHMMYQTD